MVLEYLLHSKKCSRIFRSDFFLAMQPRWNDLPMRLRHIEWSVPQSSQYLRKTCGICHHRAILPEWFCNHHFCACWLSSACHVLCSTCTVAQMVHVWHRGWDSFMTKPGIDRTSYLALYNCRILFVGCMNLPHAQYIMPASQHEAELGHCILEEVSQSSKYSVFPMMVINSFDFSLNGLNSAVLFKPFINESRLGWFSNCWINLLTVSLRFCNQRHHDKFPCTYLADFLQDACDVCPRGVSNKFPCTARTVRCDGRWIFSLRDREDPDVHIANLAWAQRAVALGDWFTLQYKSSPVFKFTTSSIQIAGSVLKRAIAHDRIW